MNETTAVASSIRAAILRHVKEFWSHSTVLEKEWQAGPIKESLPGYRVLVARSQIPGRPIVYVTNGCFLAELDQHVRHEFFLVAPTEESQHVETLTMLADFHADQRYRVNLGSVVNIGRPWVSGSECDHLLVSIPYLYGPKLEWLKTSDVCVRFLWALPITAREAAFIELNGVEAMEQKFDQARVDYLNPHRSSLA